MDDKAKLILKDIHKIKIDLSDEILVNNREDEIMVKIKRTFQNESQQLRR